ncbi:hypothetical protein E3H11_08940 [Bradyrhizobium brasilense]|nr:hypothetical protein [Bradyrhizobium brasilense]
MRSFKQQTAFWAPKVLPTVVPIEMTASPIGSDAASHPLIDLAAGQVRRAADGWHAGVRSRIGGDYAHLRPALAESLARFASWATPI